MLKHLPAVNTAERDGEAEEEQLEPRLRDITWETANQSLSKVGWMGNAPMFVLVSLH